MINIKVVSYIYFIGGYKEKAQRDYLITCFAGLNSAHIQINTSCILCMIRIFFKDTTIHIYVV